MKRLLLLASLMALCYIASARPVSPAQARQVAVAFLQGIGCKQAQQAIDRSADLPYRQFYLFAADEGGFVLVSADDCVTPILGYSATSRFDSKAIPAHVADWLGGYEEQIAYWSQLDSLSQPLRGSGQSATAQQWQRLLQGLMPTALDNSPVSPLLSTTWNQQPRYNDRCPADAASTSGHAVAGCVAIASAQVMKYWNHPAAGYGSASYYCSPYGQLGANLDTAYLWALMPNALSASSSAAQIDAVATLVYHIGVALQMEYGVASSNAYPISNGFISQPCAENALRDNFKYKSTLHAVYRADYTPAGFDSILNAELQQQRPILFSGYDTNSGHSFVVDGIDSSARFHINWGWGGWCDGNYVIGALNPAPGGTGASTSGTYNLSNNAIIGIEPDTAFSPTTYTYVTATADSASLGTVWGGGQYLFGDTVRLYTHAMEGCRFVQWSDGSTESPRQFIAHGGSYSLTAQFERLRGDTLGYCSNTAIAHFGNAAACNDWGIRLPASILTAGHHLMQTQFFAADAGSYTLRIYVGNLSTLTHTQTFTVDNAQAGSWNTITLTTPVAVSGNDDIWIALNHMGPAALAFDGGNTDGMLWTDAYQSLRDTYPYTFMIRGIFSNDISPIYGDSLSYCQQRPYVRSIGAGGSLYWGIKIPGTQLVGRNYLASVQLFVPTPGTYHLVAVQGNEGRPADLTFLESVTFGAGDTNQWQSIPIHSYFPLHTTEPLWIAFFNSDAAYPAAACTPMGDTCSAMVSLNGTAWQSLYRASGTTQNYSWMIRCVTSSTPPDFSVGITGNSRFRTQTTQTFAARSNRPHAAYRWEVSDDTTSVYTDSVITYRWQHPGTYAIVASAAYQGDTVRDTLTIEAYACDTATLPWNENFDQPLSDCWTHRSCAPYNDNLPIQYERWFVEDAALHSAIYAGGSGTASRWIFSPAIQLPTDSICTLDFDYSFSTAYYNTPKLSLFVATQPHPDSAQRIFTRSSYTNTGLTHQTVDLSAYAGQTIYLGLCDSSQYTANTLNEINIDRLALAAIPYPPATYTVTVETTDPLMGQVTGNGTYEEGSTATIAALPYEGYHFLQWADNVSDNPRTLVVTCDTTFTAIFAQDTIIPDPDSVYVTVISADTLWGSVTGSGRYAAGDTIVITALPAYGCAFVQWSDSVSDNPRTLVVTCDTAFTACFTTTGTPTVISPLPATETEPHVRKILHRNRIYIERDGNRYDLLGRRVLLPRKIEQ